MGFYYAIITKASSIKDWIDRLAKQSSEWKIRYIKKFKLLDIVSYGLNWIWKQ